MPLPSPRPGQRGEFRRQNAQCQALEFYDFADADIALFACGSGPAEEYAPKAAAAGCVVIDNSSLYRMEADVPLIVPEVNRMTSPTYTAQYYRWSNRSTAQLVVALKPCTILPKSAAVVATYQSVSRAGMPPWTNCFADPRRGE